MKAIITDSRRRKDDVGATLICANLRCAVPLRLPPPLWGRLGWGVVPRGTALLHSLTPTPDPSPQGGGEESAAPLQRKLAPMGATVVVALCRMPRKGRPQGSPLQQAMCHDIACAAAQAL